MRSKPKQYKGKEITPEIIARIKEIAQSRYDTIIYQDYFEELETLKDLCKMHDVPEENETIILGEDWFIAYAIHEIEVQVLEWISIEHVDNKMSQIREMLNTIKYLLYLAKKTCISAYLRHDTSYKFYQLGIKRGMIQPAVDEATIDFSLPEVMDETFENLKAKYSSIDNFLQSEEANNYPEYEKYILHRVLFTPTKSFIKSYKKSQNKKS